MIRQGTHSKRSLIGRARHLRANRTYGTTVMWHIVRDRRVRGVKFRREHQIDHYIVDFFAVELNLVIECDGEPHFDEVTQKYDDRRTEYLQSRGMTVLRFENEFVVTNPTIVQAQIERTVDALRR